MHIDQKLIYSTIRTDSDYVTLDERLLKPSVTKGSYSELFFWLGNLVAQLGLIRIKDTESKS